MALYILGQPKDYMRVGMDYMQTYNQRLLSEMSQDVKYICTELPDSKEAGLYEKAGIRTEQMVNVYQYFTEGSCFRDSVLHSNHVLDFSVRVKSKLEVLKNSLHYTNVEYHGLEIWLVKEGYVIATIWLDEKEKDYVRRVSYFSYTRLVRSEIYLEGFTYVESYVTAKSENGLYAKLVRRSFYDGNGSVAYEQIFEGKKEWYLFPDGRRYVKQQFVVEFVKRMLVGLSEEDIVLLDDFVPDEFVRAVFTYGKAARIGAVIHARADLSREGQFPYYWFPYSELLDLMVVSTEEQKENLTRELKACHCNVPNIKVTPIDGEFSSAVIYESYGGNLALSWVFKGKADGFLIYDKSERKICESRNAYQHYFLIEGYKEEGYKEEFIVKAFVDAIKGKVVVAESKIVRLQERQYEKPEVSLVIPVYNSEGYIARTIDNALASSLSDLEIIAVDDGSTDGTPQILDWYAERFSNVIVIYKKNEGVATARNTGIECANGEYIGFMDNDDMIHPDMMARMFESVKRNECDIAVTSVHMITNQGYNGYVHYDIREDAGMSADEFFKAYIYGHGLGVVVWNKLYRASIVKHRHIPNLPYEDVAWTPCMLLDAEKVCYLNAHFYEWDRTVRSSTLFDYWESHEKSERFESRKRAVLYYLENGNSTKMRLLKECAKRYLLEWGIMYAYDEYGKLWKWIDENF